MQIELVQRIKDSAHQLHNSIVDLRRDLHRHPELSFQEKRTSSVVKEFLQKHEIQFTDGWAGTGVVGTILGSRPGPTIMLRADMDALPIQEENNTAYTSIHQGIMHACGHDVHTSCLLGAAAILQKHATNLSGEIKLIFQPGEEKLPGGASLMLKEGLFSPKAPEWIIGQHVFPSLPAGHVGFRSGLYMASADEIYITIHGKGGHAAMPHLSIDPIVLSARIINSLQEIVKNIEPITPIVLTIGKIQSDGGATNVIPDRVFMEGTLRMMDEEWRFKAHDQIRKIIHDICLAAGATADIDIRVGYPCLQNDERVTALCQAAANQFLGDDKVHERPLRMSSEDFAFYSQAAPAAFYRLGTGWEDPDRNFPVHSSRFDIDEKALETGMGLMAYIVLSSLEG